MSEAKSKALHKKMEEKEGKKCKNCGSKKHMLNECNAKEKGDEAEGKKEERDEK